jgi:hypothetical protein
MNLLESVSWIMFEFAPILCALSIDWKIVEKFKPKVEEKKVGHTIVL